MFRLGAVKTKLKSLFKNPRPSKVLRQFVHEVSPQFVDNISSEVRISDSIDDNDDLPHLVRASYDSDDDDDDPDDNIVNKCREENSVDEFEKHSAPSEAQLKERKRQSATYSSRLEAAASAQLREAGIYKHFESPVGGRRDEDNTKDMIMRSIRFLIWLHFILHGQQIDLEILSIIEFFVIFVKR